MPGPTAACIYVCAGQRGGGCEIRTREGLPPTRFPTMLAGVHRGPPPSVTCPNMIGAVAGERRRTEVNETETETAGQAARCGAARLRSDAPGGPGMPKSPCPCSRWPGWPPARPRPKKGGRYRRPRHDRLHVTGDPPPADRADPGLRARPRRRLVLVALASATPIPGPALPLPAARIRIQLTSNRLAALHLTTASSRPCSCRWMSVRRHGLGLEDVQVPHNPVTAPERCSR
jgi:hypothetical protein